MTWKPGMYGYPNALTVDLTEKSEIIYKDESCWDFKLLLLLSLVRSFVRSLVRSLGRSLVRLFVRSFLRFIIIRIKWKAANDVCFNFVLKTIMDCPGTVQTRMRVHESSKCHTRLAEILMYMYSHGLLCAQCVSWESSATLENSHESQLSATLILILLGPGLKAFSYLITKTVARFIRIVHPVWYSGCCNCRFLFSDLGWCYSSDLSWAFTSAQDKIAEMSEC